MLLLGGTIAAALSCRPTHEEKNAPPPSPPAMHATERTDGPSGSVPQETEMTENELSTNGYLIDVRNLPLERADAWRSRAWLLAMVSWGTRDRLVKIAQAVAAEEPAASAWIAFKQGEEQVVLVMRNGEVTLDAIGDLPGRLAKTYALDAGNAKAANGSLMEFDHPGMELAHGNVGAAQRFDSTLLRQGTLAGMEIGAFRIEGQHYITPEDLERLKRSAVATDRSVSAALVATYLKTRTGLTEGSIPNSEQGRAVAVFMSLPPWFSYELRGIATEQDRSQGWVIHRIVARGLP